jgi:hypothetical protein
VAPLFGFPKSDSRLNRDTSDMISQMMEMMAIQTATPVRQLIEDNAPFQTGRKRRSRRSLMRILLSLEKTCDIQLASYRLSQLSLARLIPSDCPLYPRFPLGAIEGLTTTKARETRAHDWKWRISFLQTLSFLLLCKLILEWGQTY